MLFRSILVLKKDINCLFSILSFYNVIIFLNHPFIDYPELASFIWGKDTANVFFTNPEDMASVIFTPDDLEVIDFDYIDRNEPGHIDVILRGRNITDDVHLKYDNGILSSTLDHIEYEKFNSGIEIGFSVISQEEGEFNIPALLSSNSSPLYAINKAIASIK